MEIMGYMVNWVDVINGFFEIGGGIVIWGNVKRLWKDKKVMGIDWRINGFFGMFSIWNLVFYSSVNCWFSVIGSMLLMLGNVSWVLLYVYIMKFYNKKEV